MDKLEEEQMRSELLRKRNDELADELDEMESRCQGLEEAARSSVPEESYTEFRVIGEADLDTVPIRRVRWEAPNRFDSRSAAVDHLDEVRRTDPGAINPRIEQRPVGDWQPLDDSEEEGK